MPGWNIKSVEIKMLNKRCQTPEKYIPAMNKLVTEPQNYRWRILALLFFATTINYIDRQVIGILNRFYVYSNKD